MKTASNIPTKASRIWHWARHAARFQDSRKQVKTVLLWRTEMSPAGKHTRWEIRKRYGLHISPLSGNNTRALFPLLGRGTNLLVVLERLEILRKIRASPQVDREHVILSVLLRLWNSSPYFPRTPGSSAHLHLSLVLALGEPGGLAPTHRQGHSC